MQGSMQVCRLVYRVVYKQGAECSIQRNNYAEVAIPVVAVPMKEHSCSCVHILYTHKQRELEIDQSELLLQVGNSLHTGNYRFCFRLLKKVSYQLQCKLPCVYTDNNEDQSDQRFIVRQCILTYLLQGLHSLCPNRPCYSRSQWNVDSHDLWHFSPFYV